LRAFDLLVSPRRRVRLAPFRKDFGQLDAILTADVGASLLGKLHPLYSIEHLRLGPADLLAAGGEVFIDRVGERFPADLGGLDSARLGKFLLPLDDPAFRDGAVAEGARFPVDNLAVLHNEDLS
jgi:hypothetical protein